MSSKKKKRKRIKLLNWSKDQVEDFQYELRLFLLEMGARQINGFRFEYSFKLSNGKIVTHRYDLLKRALCRLTLGVNWKRKGKTSGGLDPYRWYLDSVGWYPDLRIVFKDKKKKQQKHLKGLIPI